MSGSVSNREAHKTWAQKAITCLRGGCWRRTCELERWRPWRVDAAAAPGWARRLRRTGWLSLDDARGGVRWLRCACSPGLAGARGQRRGLRCACRLSPAGTRAQRRQLCRSGLICARGQRRRRRHARRLGFDRAREQRLRPRRLHAERLRAVLSTEELHDLRVCRAGVLASDARSVGHHEL